MRNQDDKAADNTEEDLIDLEKSKEETLKKPLFQRILRVLRKEKDEQSRSPAVTNGKEPTHDPKPANRTKLAEGKKAKLSVPHKQHKDSKRRVRPGSRQATPKA